MTHKRIARARARAGMTMLEVVIAMSILGGALLSMAAFTGRLAHTTGTSRLQTTANQLVSDRIETVKGAPRYTAIESLYVKTESSLSGYPRFTRRTMVVHIGGAVKDSVDYKTITVEVTHPLLTNPVRKTTVISYF
jgi:prepilin-type N-terminal cleavage/methylation domain-containing protein